MSGGVSASINRPNARFLVVLFGTLEFDGRAQRMLEVLRNMGGDVVLIDIAPPGGAWVDVVPGIKRVSVEFPQRTGTVGRHIRLMWVALREARRVKPQVVVAENYFTSGTAWFAAKVTGARLVYDAYELLIPEVNEVMSRRDWIWYALERWVVKRADCVFAANEERARLMAEHYRLDRVPIVVRNIPPERTPDVDEDQIVARYPALARSSNDERIILYQGDVSLSRGLGRFVEALRHLPASYRLVVVGGGPDLERLKEMAMPFEMVGRFHAVGRVPNKILPALTRLADVGIVTYPFKGLNNIYCAPNKIFEYAQAGVPVVATDQPPLRRMIETYGIGVCIGETDSAEQIAAAIRAVAQRGRGAYIAALQRFLADHRWEDDVERIVAAIDSLVSPLPVGDAV